MALKFRKKRRLDIDFIPSMNRFAYIIDFKGKNIEDDVVSLCYLRVCVEVLLWHSGTGSSGRMPPLVARGEEDPRRPYIAYCEGNSGFPTKTTLSRYISEIHNGAETLYDACVAQNTKRPMNAIWSLR